MLFDVQTISKQTIKPSSPTPNILQTLQLSSLDQTAPQIYTHIILFYSTNTATCSSDQISIKLKTSLSQTLTHLYPLAGRIKLSPSNILHVECKDEGVEFSETRTDTDFNSFILNPAIDQFNNLLPIKVTEFRWAEDPLLAVQLTMFRGKGFALGISMSHLIADGASIALFLNCWADITRGIDPVSSRMPQFNAAAVFPHQTKLANRPLPDKSSTRDNDAVVIRRFVISPQSIQRLRKCGGGNGNSTRVEAVSELVWRCLNRSRRNAGSMMTSVNLRKKVSALSERSFGNLWISAVAAAEESMRSAVRRVDQEYVRSRESSGWERSENVQANWIFSSWCRISLYSTDFGWGEPTWLACGIKDMKDVCILIDSKDGDGVEVWLWLATEDMERIERDDEFLAYSSKSLYEGNL